ncbi:MAG: IS982 family transposase [Chloroflexota bacterium]|jgi:hypothetical protein|nr:IS982 family transposase [Chloroflexota bacterium]
MDSHIVAGSCICDDMLTALHHRDDPHCHLTDAESMTVAIGAALFFGGNNARAQAQLVEHHYLATALSARRFNRRLQRSTALVLTLFALLGAHWKARNAECVDVIASFRSASCDNIRIKRSRRYQGEADRGSGPSKRRYCSGLRVHLLVTANGEPGEVFLLPGADNDTGALQWYQFDLPPGATIIGDNACNHSRREDDLAAVGLTLAPLRKKNAKRAIPAWATYWRQQVRQSMETVGSLLSDRFPNTIRAGSAAGFELKIGLFVLAYSIDCL